MNIKLDRIVGQLVPFIMLGIAVAFIIGLFVVFSYLLVWGLFIGVILWVTTLVKNYFFPKPALKKSSGRVIEHDDKD